MNVDRTLDFSGKRWRGKVVNVMDPKQQGRIQVRVVGLHDNESLIPDRDLPWALVRMPMGMGASVRGVSASPTGVIPGTIVDGYFADSDRTTLVATGTLISAGRTRSGQTVDGSYALDSNYNDLAHPARGQDLNAALGLKNFPALSQVGAVFPVVSAGLGALPTYTGNLLSLMSEVDPLNMSGTMANSIEGFSSSYMLNQLTDVASSFVGGIGGLLGVLGEAQDLLSQGMAEAEALAALPTTLRSMASSPAGIAQLISMASSVSGVNPVSLLNGTAIGGVVNQALGVASFIGADFSSVINQLAGNLAITNKLRKYAMQAASPEMPPVPEQPTSTSSSAVTTGSSGKNPFAGITNAELPPTVTSAEVLNTMLDTSTPINTEVTAAEIEQINSDAENKSIMDQINQQNQSETAAAAQAQDQQQQQSIQIALQFGMGA